MKSTEFMAPPTFAFRLMREAVLELAVDHESVRSLINPRQTSATTYLASKLNARDSQDDQFKSGPRTGETLHSVPLIEVDASGGECALFMSDLATLGSFALIRFGEHVTAPLDPALSDGANPVVVIDIVEDAHQAHALAARIGPGRSARILLDRERRAATHYDALAGASYLVRPDGHVLGRWRQDAGRRAAFALADALFGLIQAEAA